MWRWIFKFAFVGFLMLLAAGMLRPPREMWFAPQDDVMIHFTLFALAGALGALAFRAQLGEISPACCVSSRWVTGSKSFKTAFLVGVAHLGTSMRMCLVPVSASPSPRQGTLWIFRQYDTHQSQ